MLKEYKTTIFISVIIFLAIFALASSKAISLASFVYAKNSVQYALSKLAVDYPKDGEFNYTMSYGSEGEFVGLDESGAPKKEKADNSKNKQDNKEQLRRNYPVNTGKSDPIVPVGNLLPSGTSQDTSVKQDNETERPINLRNNNECVNSEVLKQQGIKAEYCPEGQLDKLSGNCPGVGDAYAYLKTRLCPGKDASHVLKMNPKFACALAQLIKSSGLPVYILSGYRSPTHQEALFKRAIAKYGSCSAARKYVAPPPGYNCGGKVARGSNHNRGCAADIKVFSCSRNPARGGILHRNASKFGLWFRMAWEPWHIEPLPQNMKTWCGVNSGSASTNTPVAQASNNESLNGASQYQTSQPFYQQNTNNVPPYNYPTQSATDQQLNWYRDQNQYARDYAQSPNTYTYSPINLDNTNGHGYDIEDLSLEYAINNASDKQNEYDTAVDDIFSSNQFDDIPDEDYGYLQIDNNTTLVNFDEGVNTNNKLNNDTDSNQVTNIVSDSISTYAPSGNTSNIFPKKSFGILDIIAPESESNAYTKQMKQNKENDSTLSYTDLNFPFLIHKGDGKINTSVYNKVAPAIYPNRSENSNYTGQSSNNNYNLQESAQKSTQSLYRQVTNSAFDVFLNSLIPGFSAFSNLFSI